MNYYYLSDGTKTSAVTDAGTGLIYRGPFTYRTAAGGTLSFESAAVPQGRLTPEFGIPLSDHGARMYSSTLRR